MFEFDTAGLKAFHGWEFKMNGEGSRLGHNYLHL